MSAMPQRFWTDAWLAHFMRFVERDAHGCWIWTARIYQGYAHFGGRLAHRLAYRRLVGPVPEGLELDHLCNRPACVNPAHLEPVTHEENMRRRMALITHCAYGHEFTPENTRQRGTRRHCRACDRRRQAEYKARKRAVA